ncbi:MAG: HepT-like ribonuclease domain-containing protein [Thermoplasmata archaeon]
MTASEERDRLLIHEMLRHIAVIRSATEGGKDSLSEPKNRYAAEHGAELLAEAAEKVSNPFKTANPGVPWERVKKLRKTVAHPYDLGATAVDIEEIWVFATDDAPKIARKLRNPKLPTQRK